MSPLPYNNGVQYRVLIVSLAIIALTALTVGTVLAADVNGNTLNYLGRVYSPPSNNQPNFTTFTYQMTSKKDPQLEYWVLEFCYPPSQILDVREDGQSVPFTVGPDLETGVDGIRMDSPYSKKHRTKRIEIILLGNVPEGTARLDVGTRNGNHQYALTPDAILGPTCDAGATPVTLSHFQAQRAGDVVRFAWSTATEVGNVGFNLYVKTDAGPRRINDELIPSRVVDAMEPQNYVYEAWGIEGDTFFVDDIDVRGRRRVFGPFKVGRAYGRQVTVKTINWPAILTEHETRIAKRIASYLEAIHRQDIASLEHPTESALPGTAQASGLAPAPEQLLGCTYTSANLLVNRDGLYRVTYEMLRDAGFDLQGVPLISLALENWGAPVPIYVTGHNNEFGPGAYIEFYGEALDTLYTDTNVYTLKVDRRTARRVSVNNQWADSPAEPPLFYLETLTVENNQAYSPYSPSGDPWYDTGVLAYKEPAKQTFEFEVKDYVKGAAPATLSVDVWGGSARPPNPDHHVEIQLNGVPVAGALFDGITDQRLDVELPAGLLREGTNTLTLALPHDTGAEWDIVNLESYSVRYPRAFTARDSQVRFNAAGDVLRVDGLPAPHVIVWQVDEDSPVRIEALDVSGNDGNYTVKFPGIGEPATYIVTTEAGLLTPTIQPARHNTDITTGPAEYLIIAHPDFVDGLDRLVRAREAQGLTVRVINVEDIYAQFSYGILDPQAIRDYITFAAQNMGTKYVLLVGGDSYDYRNYLDQTTVSFIPSLYAPTGDLVQFAPVDPLYADIDDDGVPDLPIGRFPVRTAAELDSLVTKTLTYEARDYKHTAIFAADAFDGRTSFAADSDSLIRQLGAGWSVQRAYIDELGVGGARELLLTAVNEGVALTNYVGHSGYANWSFAGLFQLTDAATLTNAGRPTVVVQWGCWNTWYVSPSYDTLSAALLLSGDHGAAAVMGASTLTMASSEEALGRLVIPRLTQPGVTIGAAVQAAKAELSATQPDMADVLLGWTILGDPALMIEP